MTSRIIRATARLLAWVFGFSAIGAFIAGSLAFAAGKNPTYILGWAFFGDQVGAAVALALAVWSAE